MKFLRSYWLSVSLLIFVLPSLAQHGLSEERLHLYDQFLENEVKEFRTAGAVSLIYRKGEIAHHWAYGKAQLDQDAPMSTDHLFFIQSMTKPIISVAFMMLYEEGHFLLDDPVASYIPKFKDLKVSLDPSLGLEAKTEPLEKPITLRHLLSHTAGLSHGLGSSKLDRAYLEAMYLEPHATVQERMNRMLELPLMGQPGAQWYYSAAPDVLSVLIEQFSGQSVDEFLKARIFDPLGMSQTGYNLTDDQLERVVTVYERDQEGQLIPAEYQPPKQGNTLWSGVNGLYATAGDYLKFCQMLLNGGSFNGQRFLSRKTVEWMTLNHVGDLYAPQGFGLGFAVLTDLSASQVAGSEGQYWWNGAYRTHFFIDPEEELIAILMTQTNPYSNYYAEKMRQFVYQAIED